MDIIVGIVGASAGYVYGFLLATIICRLLMRNNKTIPMMIAASFIFTIITYVCGVYWLHHTLNPLYGTPMFGGPNSAFALGCWPFLIGDLLKTITAIAVAYALNVRAKIEN
jgi:biotin transporter BioY